MPDSALSICQPMASAVMRGANVVSRRWPTSFRGRLWVHADEVGVDDRALRSQAIAELLDPEGASIDEPRMPDVRTLPHGVLLGWVQVVDCHEARTCCFPFGEQRVGTWHLVVERPVRLPRPVLVRGKSGIWQLDGSVARAVGGYV